MKGFTHFVTGLAVTSFFPWAVQAAAEGNPFYFLLGGTCALLPDTLDFRILRYFYRHHIEVTPDPLCPDMQMVADAIALAIDRAEQKKIRIRLNTIRSNVDTWQRYQIHIDPRKQVLTASLEEAIDTGGNPVDGVSLSKQVASAPFHTPVSLEYMATFSIEMFDGPHLECKPTPKGLVLIRFIPWHRAYTHSMGISTILAAAAVALGAWPAAIVGWSAHASHVLLDQLGYMGSDLLWPLSHRRFPGFKLQHASSSFWNLAAVWIAIAMLFSNIHSHAHTVHRLPPIGYIAAVIILPLAILHKWLSPAD